MDFFLVIQGAINSMFDNKSGIFFRLFDIKNSLKILDYGTKLVIHNTIFSNLPYDKRGLWVGRQGVMAKLSQGKHVTQG